jgi:phosphoglucomutase
MASPHTTPVLAEALLKQVRLWAEDPYFSPADRLVLQKELEALPTSAASLTEAFYKHLEFGTGGMRGLLGLGDNRLNIYTIRKATTALLLSLKEKAPELIAAGRPLVVSYDTRHYSRTFAEEVCATAYVHGVPTVLFETPTPTPILSFAVRELRGCAGVMITASHNPPEYNGYKVFWNDGAQVTPPYDQCIIEHYQKLTKWSEIKTSHFSEAVLNKKCLPPSRDIFEKFYQVIQTQVLQNPKLFKNSKNPLKVIYTSLHGSGLEACQELMQKKLNLQTFQILASQASFDGSFPTVKYPNPEDPEALVLVVEEMLAQKADIALATDPDCDRLGVVVNHQGQPHYLNGNQIGVLLLHYLLTQKKAQGTLTTNHYVVKSIVTTPLQDVLCEAFGVKIYSTLTGFKWMAKLIAELEKKSPTLSFLFASEESFGYMPQAQGRDKDGVSSVALMCEVAQAAKDEGLTLVDKLKQISEEFGNYQEALVAKTYEGLKGAEKIDRIMKKFRSFEKTIADLPLVKSWDYLSGIEKTSSSQNNIAQERSNVLGYVFSDGDQLFLRPSGTEPKIKFYLMLKQKDLSSAAKENVAQKLQLLKEFIEKTCLEA